MPPVHRRRPRTAASGDADFCRHPGAGGL